MCIVYKDADCNDDDFGIPLRAEESQSLAIGKFDGTCNGKKCNGSYVSNIKSASVRKNCVLTFWEGNIIINLNSTH